MAWLVGLRYGQNKKAGDFSISGDFRQQGISALDPNINNSNFALSNLNTQGWYFTAAYNFNDFLTAVVSFYYCWALNPNLYGSFATGNVTGPTVSSSSSQWPIARDRFDRIVQVNLLMKF
jgi:hypothetical protein